MRSCKGEVTEKLCRSSWVRALLAAVLVLMAGAGAAHAQTTITRTSSWTYDPTTGLMTSETVEPGGTSTMTTKYTYDAYGNKTVVQVSGTGVATRTTTTYYDSHGEFVTKIMNDLGQDELWTYDPRFGVPLAHIGPNEIAGCSSSGPCLETTWQYNGIGQKNLETRPDGSYTSWTFCYANSPNTCSGNFAYGVTEVSDFLVEETSNSGTQTTVEQSAPQTQVFYDSLGRAVRKTQQGLSGSVPTWIYSDTQYDSLGRVAQTSAPYFAGGNPVWTVYGGYDALGRPAYVMKPDSSGPTGAAQNATTQYYYKGLETEVIDPNGNKTITWNNDFGLPYEVQDANGSYTSYSYDAVGDLLQIEDSAGNLTTYQYDIRGRKILMMDPDRGEWSYSYDGLGELVGSEDADADFTAISYDPLGRMTNRITTKNNQTPQTDSWVYDTATNGIGKLAATESCDVKTTSCFGDANDQLSLRTFTYDVYGRAIGTSIQAGTTSPVYNTSETYDGSSRLATLTYASGYELGYSYSAIGTLSSVAGLPGGMMWTLNVTNAQGQAVQETLGDNVVINNTYDPLSSRLMTTQAGYPGNWLAENLSYTYDLDGDVLTRSDASVYGSNVVDSLTYDSLNRLTQDAVTDNGAPVPNGTKTVLYDAYGDIAYKSDVGNYFYSNSYHVHAVSKISSNGKFPPYNVASTFTYDSDGNALTGDGYTNTWTPFNMVASVTQGTNVYNYTYDETHQRVTQIGPAASDVTQYIDDPASGAHSEALTVPNPTNTGTITTINDFLTAGGEVFALHKTVVTYITATNTTTTQNKGNSFLLHDRLDSVVAVVGGGGSVLENDSYDAWGKRRNTNGADDVNDSLTSLTTRGYTNQEQITGITLLNYNARLYDPLIGRFLSPDPEVANTYDLQALNAYSYVLNNPMSANDPTGMKCHGWFGCTFGGFGTQILALVAVVTLQYEALPFIEGTTFAAESVGEAFANAVIAGAAGSAITSGGNLQAIAIGAAEAAAFYGVGSATDGHFGVNGLNGANQTIAKWAEQDPGEFAANVAGHGLVGGLANVAEGGKFESGFLAAGFSDAAGPLDTGNFVGNLALAATIGGTSSVLGGGQFANGADTAAFGYLFNSEAGKIIGGVVGAAADAACDAVTEGACTPADGAIEEGAIKAGDLATDFPPNNGFLGTIDRLVLNVGQTIDRFGGSVYSRFFSPSGVPAEMRSLPPGVADQPLRTFEVTQPFEVESGTVAPYYDQPGLGIQYRSPMPLGDLLDQGYLTETTK